MDDSYDTFSKDIPATSENYYTLTFPINNNKDDESLFKTEDSYFEDVYFPVDDHDKNNSVLFSNKNNDSFLIPEGSFMDDTYTGYYNNTFGKQTNSNAKYTLNEELIDKSVRFININTNIYNSNVRLYKKSIIILEKYINFLFTISDDCFENIISVIKRMKSNDNRRNIKRDYTSLLNYIISVYNIYEKFIYSKIKELKSYYINIEKNLLKHGHILYRCIWFYYIFIQLPENNGINYYENYLMKQNFDNVNKEFQLYFKSLYFKLNLSIIHD